MNQNKEELLLKLEELQTKESNILKLCIKQDIHPYCQHYLWYHGTIGVVQYQEYLFSFDIVGKCVVDIYEKETNRTYHIQDLYQNGEFFKELYTRVETDEELLASLKGEGKYEFDFKEKPIFCFHILNTVSNEIVELGAFDNELDTEDVLEPFEKISRFINQLEIKEII